jgi:hypothetical protein
MLTGAAVAAFERPSKPARARAMVRVASVFIGVLRVPDSVWLSG